MMLLHECITGSDLTANLERHMVEKGLLHKLGTFIVDYKDFGFKKKMVIIVCVLFLHCCDSTMLIM